MDDAASIGPPVLAALGIVAYAALAVYVRYIDARAQKALESQPTADSGAAVDAAVLAALLDRRASLLNGVFVYPVVVRTLKKPSATTAELRLAKGQLLANNLYIHFHGGVVNTLLLPGLHSLACRITSAAAEDDVLVYQLSIAATSDTNMTDAATSFLRSAVATAVTDGSQHTVLALWIDYE